MLLHTFSNSPFATNTFSEGLQAVRKGDCIMLLGDAVYAALASSALGDIISRHSDVRWHAIDEDLDARGIIESMMLSLVKRASYADFVELTLQSEKMIAW